MTMLDERRLAGATPAPPPLRDRGLMAPWRLAARLAWRETRRRPGRTALAAVLIAVPVIAMTLGSVLVRSDAHANSGAVDFHLRYGDRADVAYDPWTMFSSGPSSPDDVEVPAGTQVVRYLWVQTSITPVDDGRPAQYVTLTDLDPADPIVGETVEIDEGRAPREGELLIGHGLANAWDVGVGDQVELARPAGTWTVAGIGRYRADYWWDVVVAPGFDRDRIDEDSRSLVTVYDMPAGTPTSEIDRVMNALGGRSATSEQSVAEPVGNEIAWGWVGGVLALVATGIIVAAAFATSARRQLVTVGQLASNGATPSLVRRTLALQGTWTAAAGAVAGLVVGLASLPVVLPRFEVWFAKRSMPATIVRPGDLVIALITALVAGTLAAAVPARSISRTPVMSALAGRKPLGAPPRWLVPAGLALFLGGLGVLFLAAVGARAGGTSDPIALAIILGGVAVVFGVICATPLLIDRIGRLARVLPLSPRLALRGMARSRTRSSAIVAAIVVAAGGGVAVATIAEAAIQENAFYRQAAGANLAPGSAVILAYDDTCCVGRVDPGYSLPRTLDADQLAQLERVLPGATVAPLLVASFDPPPFSWSEQESIQWPTGDGPWVATPAVLDALGYSEADRERLAAEGALVGAPGATDGQFVPADGEAVEFEFGVGADAVVFAAGYSDDVPAAMVARYSPIVTREFAESIGFRVVERGVVVTGIGSLTQQQYNDLYTKVLDVATSGDVFVEPGDVPRGTQVSAWNLFADPIPDAFDRSALWIARAAVVAAALVLVSLVVAIGLALAAVEGREERETLAIVGATPVTMRRQAAVRAALLALVGIALGIPTGYLPVEVVGNADSPDGNQFLRFPWITSLLLLAAVPLAVAGSAWLASAVGQRLRPVRPTRRD